MSRPTTRGSVNVAAAVFNDGRNDALHRLRRSGWRSSPTSALPAFAGMFGDQVVCQRAQPAQVENSRGDFVFSRNVFAARSDIAAPLPKVMMTEVARLFVIDAAFAERDGVVRRRVSRINTRPIASAHAGLSSCRAPIGSKGDDAAVDLGERSTGSDHHRCIVSADGHASIKLGMSRSGRCWLSL